MRIVIVGAGIIGTAAAHALLDDGHTVTLVDPAGVGEGASKGNAGWIAHMDVMPLASSKAWRHLPRWLLDPLGPLAVRPAYLPRLLPWLLRFALCGRPSRVRRSMEGIAALNRSSLPAWERLLERLGENHRLRPSGILSVFSCRRDFEAALPTLAVQERLGIPHESLDRAQLTCMEPALGAAAVAAVHYPTGCHVDDPGALTARLGEKARERGAHLVQDEVAGFDSGEMLRVRLAGGRALNADRVVLSAGAFSRRLAKQVGDRVPLDTERGYNATFAPGTFGLRRPVMFEGQGFVTTPLAGGDRVGGAVEFAGLAAASNYARVDAILARLSRFLPDAPLTGGERWMGFRPSIPDSLPVIGHGRSDDRVLYAFGHGHHGLTQAAVTAEIVAALVAGRAPPLDLQPYDPRRFSFP